MALAFPQNPAEGQVYDYPPFRYQFTSGRWLTVGKGANTVSEAILAHEAAPNIHSMAAIQWQGGLSHRNLLINGDFRVWQRGSNVSLGAGAEGYFADRWKVWADCAINTGINQSLGGLSVGHGVTIESQGAAAPSVILQQRIEAANISWIEGNPVYTFSVWIYSEKQADAIILQLYSSSSRDVFTSGLKLQSEKTLSFGGVGKWIKYSATLSVNSGDIRNGMIALIKLTGMPAGWRFYVTTCQLELGGVATPFERRPYSTELALCERYFRRDVVMARTVPANASVITFPVQMRVHPTITWVGGSGSGATWGRIGEGKGIYQATAHNLDALVEYTFDAEL